MSVEIGMNHITVNLTVDKPVDIFLKSDPNAYIEDIVDKVRDSLQQELFSILLCPVSSGVNVVEISEMEMFEEEREEER